MKVIVIGAKGQLGGDLTQVLAAAHHHVVPLTHEDIEVSNPESVRSVLLAHTPDVVINTAAYHKTDDVEKYPQRAFEVNALGALWVARACSELNAALVFISTDYVFGEDQARCQPYNVQDLPAPLNVYGVSKLAGEQLVHMTWEKHYIVRTSGVYGVRGASGKGGNFIELMLRLAHEGKDIRVVDDQRLATTFTQDLAQALENLITTGRYGYYHITNSGDCTWYEFAAKIFSLAGLSPKLTPTTSDEFKTPARRPAYSVLGNQAWLEAGLPPLRPWTEALAEYLQARGQRKTT